MSHLETGPASPGSSSQAFSGSLMALPAVEVWKSTRNQSGLRGQVSREQSCCRLCSASSPTARVTPEARPAHVLAAGQALRALAPAPQHPPRPGDASLEREADRKTPGMGPGGEKLLGARHRLLFQTVPQVNASGPVPADHAHTEPGGQGCRAGHLDLCHSSPSRVSASFSSSACCFCCWILA